MGSRVHAQKCRLRSERVVCMISLEMLGYYSDRAGSQSYPLRFLRWFYPGCGNFIALACNFRSRRLVRGLTRQMSETEVIPVEHAAFPLVPGADLSDNWSFWEEGYPGLMITDTASSETRTTTCQRTSRTRSHAIRKSWPNRAPCLVAW